MNTKPPGSNEIKFTPPPENTMNWWKKHWEEKYSKFWKEASEHIWKCANNTGLKA